VINWSDGTKIWCIYRSYGSMLLCASRDDALDQLTRKDTLVSFVVSQFTEEKV
jgi:hypothetical protein